MTVQTEGDIYLTRELPDGSLIEFEERTTGFRAYWWTGAGEERTRKPSVTTIIGAVMPKPQLLKWYEQMGAAGALTLSRRGYLDHVDPCNAVYAIREAGLGGQAELGQAAARGRRVHTVLEEYAKHGDVPNPIDYPESDRGYIRGLIRWLIKADPVITASERLVCDPVAGYAGRYDLRAEVYGHDTIVDLKTNKRAEIYREALLQVAAYDLADVACGATPAGRGMVVAVGPDGEFSEGYVPSAAWDAWANAHALYLSLDRITGPEPVS
jgi:hypothetical protein